MHKRTLGQGLEVSAIGLGCMTTTGGYSQHPDRNDMIELIADAAHELAERALRSKDIRTATWATGKGLQVEPIHEGLWRQALMAAASSGLPDRLATITARLHATLDPLGDLEDETRDLLRSLHQLPGQRSALA